MYSSGSSTAPRWPPWACFSIPMSSSISGFGNITGGRAFRPFISPKSGKASTITISTKMSATAKHAISIDEDRKDFARVPWGRKDEKLKARDSLGNLWFEQVWFPGVHADIGGGYPENESRLSDAALKWMRNCATAIPDGVNYDPD